MAIERVEEFRCTACNALIYVCWGANETSRTVSCNTCFGQDWTPPVYEDPTNPESPMIQPQGVTEHGWKGLLNKGAGLRTINRNEVTKQEV